MRSSHDVVDVDERGRRPAIGEHRAFAVGRHEHDDRAGRAAPLHTHVDPGGGELGREESTGFVVADPTDEPRRRAAGGEGGHVRRAAAAAAVDGRRIVGADGEAVGPHDDILDEVPDHGQHHRHGSGNPERGEGVAPVPWTYVRSRSLVVMFGFVGALLAAGYGVLFTLLDDFRDTYGISESALGAVIGIGFLAGFVAQIALAPLADRGHARMLVLSGMVLNIVGVVLLAASSTVVPMLGGRFVMGLGAGMAVPAIRRIVIVADPAHLGQNLGRILAADVAGFATGPAVAAIFSPIGLRAPFIFIAAVTALTIPFVARTSVVETAAPASQRLAFDLLRQRRFAGAVALGCALWLMIGAFDALWSVVLDDLDTAEWIATLGISLFALPIVLFGGIGGRLAQRVGPFRVGTVGLLLAAVFMASYGLVPSGAAMFGVAMVHAVSDGLTASSTGVAVGMVVPPERQAGAQGVLGGMETLVAGITAIGVGVLYDHAGRTTAYLVIAAAMVVVVALGAFLAGGDVVLRAASRSTSHRWWTGSCTR